MSATVITIGVLVLLIACLPLFIVKLREEKLLNCLVEKIGTLQLFMQMGSGFRSSFQSLLNNETNQTLEAQLLKMYRIVTFPQQNKAFFRSSRLAFVANELKKVDQCDYGALQRLENLKTYQKILSDFRRKSGKVKSQMYLQIWILSGIFVALLCFIAFMFDPSELVKPIFMSSSLVLIGHFISWRRGRRVKWRL